MNLTKHTGPMSGDEAARLVSDTSDSLYVLAIEASFGDYYNQEWGVHYELITASGRVLHSFFQPTDTIWQITVWKD